ncbi:MAG: hypothetical protein FWB89_03110 [Treponema sp.]|nr:hypothetical protein [Treponema sp.]
MKYLNFLLISYLLFIVDITIAQEARIRVINPTSYNVYFERNQKINKNSSGNISLHTESGFLSAGFDIWYEIPISDSVPVFLKGDHRTLRENQTSLNINEPVINENYGRFLVIKNKADNAVTFRTGGTVNSLMEQRGSFPYLSRSEKFEFSPGETAVFDISRDLGNENYIIYDSRRSIPFTIPQTLKRNYRYSFDYTVNGLIFADSRPLHRIGESGWVKSANESNSILKSDSPLSIVSIKNEIHCFASTNDGLIRHVFDSAGNSKTQVKSGGGFETTFVNYSEGNFFLAGYQIDFLRGMDIPVARVHDSDGVIRGVLPLSLNPEYYSAYFTTAAINDGKWLVAGAAGRSPDHGYLAYLRLVKNNGSALAADWEIGGKIFDSESRCAEITSVIYNAVKNSWLAAGMLNERNPDGAAAGSFIAFISEDGKVQKINTSFKGIEILKILPDSEGNYYLIGKEQKGTSSTAMIVKYDSGDRELWRFLNPPQSNSYYQGVLLDIENGQIVLGGTMRAKDGNGSGGVPFLEGINIENGTLIWREELTDSFFAGTSIVMSVAPAPDYGFVLSLCGINDGNLSRPYMAARVNVRGKL